MVLAESRATQSSSSRRFVEAQLATAVLFLALTAAGTATADSEVVTSGGRVLCVTALGENIAAAQKTCYQAADKISWEGVTLRRDIGWRAIAREER